MRTLAHVLSHPHVQQSARFAWAALRALFLRLR